MRAIAETFDTQPLIDSTLREFENWADLTYLAEPTSCSAFGGVRVGLEVRRESVLYWRA